MATKLEQVKRIAENLHPNRSESATNALNHLNTMQTTIEKFANLKTMQKKGDISLSELGKGAKMLHRRMESSSKAVLSAVNHYADKQAQVKQRQMNHLNTLDDSASVLIAQAFANNPSTDKFSSLKSDPRLLGALHKAGSFISGVPDDKLQEATDSYFKTHPDFIQDIQQLEDDKGVLAAIGKQAETEKLDNQLTEAIEAGYKVQAVFLD